MQLKTKRIKKILTKFQTLSPTYVRNGPENLGLKHENQMQDFHKKNAL